MNSVFQIRGADDRPISPIRKAGFTLVEVALCLAIIGFGLVAIIGVLPAGLNVQKENRDETVINHDASIWMEAIRNGARGLDELTNYVVVITNIVQTFSNSADWTPYGSNTVYMFSRMTSTVNGVAMDTPLFLDTGEKIVGLLSKPKLEIRPSEPEIMYSNYVIAIVRSISGIAGEKMPQTNASILNDGFAYRMIVENFPYVPFDPERTNHAAVANNPSERDFRREQALLADTLRDTSHDIRLLFRWPILPNRNVGNGRQTFRTFAGGSPARTNIAGAVMLDGTPLDLYFFTPTRYETARNP